jgi:hypothetical protein
MISPLTYKELVDILMDKNSEQSRLYQASLIKSKEEADDLRQKTLELDVEKH